MHEEKNFYCSGKLHAMKRFLEVCLLLFLSRGKSHGYGLVKQLYDFGFSKEELNESTLYRTLRKMEHDGWVSSLWEKGLKGPKRRVYLITDLGKKELEDWIEILKCRKKRIEKLIDSFKEFNHDI